MMIYLIGYGEYVKRKGPDPLCDRDGWSEPASRLLHGSMLCEWQASVIETLSLQGV
jgi:hypothetical protein